MSSINEKLSECLEHAATLKFAMVARDARAQTAKELAGHVELTEATRPVTVALHALKSLLIADAAISQAVGKRQVMDGVCGDVRLHPFHLTTWLFHRSRKVGGEQALAELRKYCVASEITARAAVICGGVKVLQTTKLDCNTWVAPNYILDSDPDWAERMASLLPYRQFILDSAPFTVFWQDVRISSVLFAGDRKEYSNDGRRHSYSETLEMVVALTSLVSVLPACPILFFLIPTLDVPIEHAIVERFPDRIVPANLEYDNSLLEKLTDYLNHYARLPLESRLSLRPPITRFHSALIGHIEKFVDACTDLRIALETSLNSQDGGTKEIGHRLALHCAHYLATSLNERKDMFKSCKRVYGMLSAVVHTGQANKEKHLELFVEGLPLVRDTLVKTLRDGELPNWLDIELGSQDLVTKPSSFESVGVKDEWVVPPSVDAN